MGVIIKEPITVPYKTLIYTLGNGNPAELYNNTGYTFSFQQVSTGIIQLQTSGNIFEMNDIAVTISQNNYGGNQTISNLQTDLGLGNAIQIICLDSNSHAYSDFGLIYMTIEVKFFNL